VGNLTELYTPGTGIHQITAHLKRTIQALHFMKKSLFKRLAGNR